MYEWENAEYDSIGEKKGEESRMRGECGNGSIERVFELFLGIYYIYNETKG